MKERHCFYNTIIPNPWLCLVVAALGSWLALVSWFPFVGNLFTLTLGFYKTNPWLTASLFLVGRFLRFFFWNLILGAV